MKITKDEGYGRVYHTDRGYNFMLLGGQPDNIRVYFVSLVAEGGIGSPLVPVERECLQREMDSSRGWVQGKPNEELLKEQLEAYYNRVPQGEGGGACFTCPLSRVVEYARKAAPHKPLALIPTTELPGM